MLVSVTFKNDSGRYINFSDTYFTNMTVDGATTQPVVDTGNGAVSVENIAGLLNKLTPAGNQLRLA